MVTFRFIFDPSVGMFSRAKRTGRGEKVEWTAGMKSGARAVRGDGGREVQGDGGYLHDEYQEGLTAKKAA